MAHARFLSVLSISKRLLIENTDTFSISKRLLIESTDAARHGSCALGRRHGRFDCRAAAEDAARRTGHAPDHRAPVSLIAPVICGPEFAHVCTWFLAVTIRVCTWFLAMLDSGSLQTHIVMAKVRLESGSLPVRVVCGQKTTLEPQFVGQCGPKFDSTVVPCPCKQFVVEPKTTYYGHDL
jgi:hypothetical protein